MEQFIEVSYAKKVNECWVWEEENSRLKDEEKVKKEKLIEWETQLQQSWNIIIKQTRTLNKPKTTSDGNCDVDTENEITTIYLKMQKLKRFQNILKSQISENEAWSIKLHKEKANEIRNNKMEINGYERNWKFLDMAIEESKLEITREENTLSRIKREWRSKTIEIENWKRIRSARKKNKNYWTNSLNNNNINVYNYKNILTLSSTVNQASQNNETFYSSMTLKEIIISLDKLYREQEGYINEKKKIINDKEQLLSALLKKKQEIIERLNAINDLKESYEANIKDPNIWNKYEIVNQWKATLTDSIVTNNRKDKLDMEIENIKQLNIKKEEYINKKIERNWEKINDIHKIIKADDLKVNEKETFIKLDSISKENKIEELKWKLKKMTWGYEKEWYELSRAARTKGRKRKLSNNTTTTNENDYNNTSTNTRKR